MVALLKPPYVVWFNISKGLESSSPLIAGYSCRQINLLCACPWKRTTRYISKTHDVQKRWLPAKELGVGFLLNHMHCYLSVASLFQHFVLEWLLWKPDFGFKLSTAGHNKSISCANKSIEGCGIFTQTKCPPAEYLLSTNSWVGGRLYPWQILVAFLVCHLLILFLLHHSQWTELVAFRKSTSKTSLNHLTQRRKNLFDYSLSS